MIEEEAVRPDSTGMVLHSVSSLTIPVQESVNHSGKGSPEFQDHTTRLGKYYSRRMDIDYHYTPAKMKFSGVYWNQPLSIRVSVRPSSRVSVCLGIRLCTKYTQPK